MDCRCVFRIVLLVLVLAPGLPARSCAAEPSPVYGGNVSVPEGMSFSLSAAVDDLLATLNRMTGKEFVRTSPAGESPTGIILRQAGAPDVPAAAKKRLPTASKESCCIWPDGEDRLWIISRSDTGLAHAVYLYLEQLGCRWYFPSAKWTLIPKRDDIRLTEPIVRSPAFRSRMFSGTGGFGGKLPLDPERTLQTRWMDWQRRNRFGGEFRVSGHTGEAFNVKHRKELEAHPEWRAMIDGNRVPWSLTAKFCAGNPEVVDLYVQDRLEFYRQARKRDPDAPRAWAVSVEPADGGGHCTAPESLAIGSVSDRVFHVANEVARAVRAEIPGGHVSLFAYNEHAAVPTIPIEPNVYVQVIPYAFQRTGMTPDQLLDAWSRKVSRMGVYDYWSIPDWSHDLPSFDPLEFGPDRLRGWHRRGVDSFLCESTFSSGAMGPAWFLTSRLAWNPDTDINALFDEFISNCFGRSAEPMRRMLTRWSRGFYLTSHELALSFRDVDEARQLAEDQTVAARVADYGRYLQYLRLRFEYLQSKRGSAERGAAADRLMRYLWSIYDSSMIHAFRLSQLLARDELIAGNTTLGETFNWQNHDAPGWPTIQPASDEEIRLHVQQGVRDLQPQEFTSRSFSGPLVALPHHLIRPAQDVTSPVLWLSNSLEFVVRTDRANVRFKAQVASEKGVRLLVSAPNGRQLVDLTLTTGPDWSESWSDVAVTLPEAGPYRFQIVSQKRTFRFRPPADIALTMSGWWNSQGRPTPRLYFFVPGDTKQLAIYTNYTAAGPPRFFNPDGSLIEATLIDNGHLMLVPIDKAHRGAVWSLDRAKCPIGELKMLNAPAAFAVSPQTLLIPSDSLRAAASREKSPKNAPR